MAYALGEGSMNPQAITNHQIGKDVLIHLRQIHEACELRPIRKRKGMALFKHSLGIKSKHPDLTLWHPSIETVPPVEGFIRVSDLASRVGRKLYYKIDFLGKESKAENLMDRNAALPNTIEINVLENWKLFIVDVQLSGPAFFQYLGDCGFSGATALTKAMVMKLRHAWGSVGVQYNTYKPMNEREIKKDGEGYRYIRMVNGKSVVQTEGASWINSQPFLQ